MRKLTRRSYNRKLIVFGLVLLMAIGMISTGFAAWVMSSVNNADADAGVTVGTISDASMDVTIDQWDEEAEEWTGDILSFDAESDDDEGRIRADADAKNQLTMTISGKVTNVAALGQLTLTIKLPESLAAAIEAEYIAIDDSDASYSAGTLTVTKESLNYTLVDDNANATFSYTLTFEWGEFFGGMNPCEFYDSTVATRDGVTGASITDENMKTEMDLFRKTITGDATNATYTGTIDITVAATTN